MTKSNLKAKVQYIHLWLMTDKLVMSRVEKKSQKHKLVAIFEVSKLKITKLTVEADGLIFFFLGGFFFFFFFFFSFYFEGIKRVVMKISTERGAFVVYVVEEDFLDDWHLDISESIEGKYI